MEVLLRSFFGFLERKTDFYVVHGGIKGEQYKAGFGPGDAEKMVLKAFRERHFRPLDTVQVQEEPTQKRSEKKPEVRYTNDGKQVPLGNGGIAKTHTWTQTLGEVTVVFDVPKRTRGKDITCTMSSTLLNLKVDKAHDLKDRKFFDQITDSTWTLDRDADGRATLVLTLEKSKESWWASVFHDDDDTIDTTLVDSSKKMDEYDEKTQAAIRKIMFDQRQKQKGLPTSDEMKTNDLLEKAKWLPGSPWLSSSSSLESHDEDPTEVGGTS